MIIKFVGTSSGKTSLTRFHSSLLLSSQNYNLLVDSGDGISRALLSQKTDFNLIDGIIITHLHPDHSAGLPSLITQMKMLNRNKPLEIFVHHTLQEIIENTLLNSYILPERLNFKIHYTVFSTENPLKISNNFNCLAKENSHLSKLEEYKDKYTSLNLISTSLFFVIDEKKICYTSDIDRIEDIFLFKEIISDVFIVEATHLNKSELLEAIYQLNSERIFLTHYPDEDEKKLGEILASKNQSIRTRLIIATDGLSIEI